MKKIKNILSLLIVIIIVVNCTETKRAPINTEYIESIKKHRTETDDWMKNGEQSPFNAKGKIEFHPLKYFPIDENFALKSKLFEYDKKENHSMFGTKGEERSATRYGFFRLKKDEQEFKVNVYSNITKTGEKYYSILFTDKTTGKETYDVGRYIEFELNRNKDFIYTIDFNLAFSPYCSYSPNYSCAIPLEEDFLDLRITAGEMKFHN
ncbi:MAG: DUF1684 domain-containing protein [Melioribacteraceae bacterium]